jgi:RHH-type proline utilization regulon transcriptional repressor/proline dehydrogenase/delta 1-pyrroline-5-carboxylate dehydrogenase
MRFTDQPAAKPGRIPYLNDLYLAEEQALVRELVAAADAGMSVREKVQATAVQLVQAVRKAKANEGGLEAFLQQYDLSSEEGVLLMCIAEALLRIPDADTADRLIADKLTSARWQDHLGTSESLFVNASTWGLMLTGRLLKLDETTRDNPMHLVGKLANRAGEPVVRTAMRQAMKIMGHQFVMGRTIEEALRRATRKNNLGYRYSFDMLGEGALTIADAERYFEAYHEGIAKIGGGSQPDAGDIFAAPGVSVKLSALHPRLEFTNEAVVLEYLVPRLTELAVHAKECGIGLTIDSEEADRLEISLELFDRVYRSPRLEGYEGFGLAVPTYQRRARDVFRYLIDLSKDVGRRIPVRLVKGAYWDAEIKRAQEHGLSSYPVFTRKAYSDVSYLACARQALAAGEALYLQFATHNAHTLASIIHFAGSRRDFEFQRLHGMGQELYAEVINPERFNRPCRVYAPVGSHEDLLPYLVRRFLENGSNTSFVNRILDESIPVEEIVKDPIETALEHDCKPHSGIPAPGDIFLPERPNSKGVNLADHNAAAALLADMNKVEDTEYRAHPIIGGKAMGGADVPSVNPANTAQVIGYCQQAEPEHVDLALERALAAQPRWDATPAAERAAVLNRAADLFEANASELLALVVKEGGRIIPDAISELREAVDFLRYYAARCNGFFGAPRRMPGPTGERNEHGLRGRGVFVCISPWNFPLAIFTGQVSAALAAGNAVLAKPAAPTPIIGFRAVQLLHEAGVPADVLHFVPGKGSTIGARVVADPRLAGVALTGSTETAMTINRTLAARNGPIGVLIAETGGQNAMFVDSTALPHQVVLDALYSAFDSAGQRCSALRILCVQEDIADKVIQQLIGHMHEMAVGDPAMLATDIGPIIDEPARATLVAHVERMEKEQTILHRMPLSAEHEAGTFFAPTLVEIDSIDALTQEVFGPVLHVYRFKARDFDKTVDAVNGTGFGLTMGLHSRIDSRARELTGRCGAGNLYVNRNIIGAVVGVQPFGGRGLSGTGPKAGGPHYLIRFGTEYTVSNNIAAVGGNASLLSLSSD